ncbi:MAG: hypothetical protein ACR5K4_02235 [Sodalis sp. (in: enterobacteria)]
MYLKKGLEIGRIAPSRYNAAITVEIDTVVIGGMMEMATDNMANSP